MNNIQRTGYETLTSLDRGQGKRWEKMLKGSAKEGNVRQSEKTASLCHLRHNCLKQEQPGRCFRIFPFQ